ncbi:MAG: hypothetical protein V1659_03690 [Candidatus Woesearchaeota archaeon]
MVNKIMTWAVIAIVLIAGAVFVSAEILQKNTAPNSGSKILDNSAPEQQPACGCGCGGQCRGTCGVESCGCGGG